MNERRALACLSWTYRLCAVWAWALAVLWAEVEVWWKVAVAVVVGIAAFIAAERLWHRRLGRWTSG